MFPSVFHFAPGEPAGGMPSGVGEMPSGGSTAPEAGYAPQDSPDVDGLAEDAEFAPDAEGVSAPAAPVAEAAPAMDAPLAPSPTQAQVLQAAQQFHQVGQHVQQRLPVVQQQRAMLEQALLPYQQNPAAFDQLAPEQQQWVRQRYGEWQGLAQEEQRLGQAWSQVEQNAPILQALYQIEDHKARLNRVGEPMAYQLLAERAKQRSGDPDFPVSDMQAFLQGVPPNALEAVAAKFEELHRTQRLQSRKADRVDAMGPTGAGGPNWDRLSGRDQVHSALRDEWSRSRR